MLLKTIDEVDKDLAKRVRYQRKKRGYTQIQFASKCNVPYGTYKQFEQTGEISLSGLTKIAAALDMAEEIDNLFARKAYSSIDEVVKDYEKYEKTGRIY